MRSAIDAIKFLLRGSVSLQIKVSSRLRETRSKLVKIFNRQCPVKCAVNM